MSNMFEILVCSNTAETCCSDYTLVGILNIVMKALKLMQIMIPIILIIMLAIQITKLVINPNEKKNISGLKNEIIATVFFFMLPYIVNAAFALLPNSFEISDCWKIATQTDVTMKETAKNKSSSTSTTSATTTTTSQKSSNKNNKTKSKSLTKIKKSIAKINSAAKNSKAKKNKLGKIKGSKKGIAIVNYARGFVGKPYKYGGSWNGSPTYTATDCSGFVQGVFKHFGINLPRTADAQYKATNMYTRVSPNDIRAGDLVFYSNPNHVAILTGNGEEIIHASTEATGVRLSSTYKTSYNKFRCIARIKGVN